MEIHLRAVEIQGKKKYNLHLFGDPEIRDMT